MIKNDEELIGAMMDIVSEQCYDEGGFIGLYEEEYAKFIALVRTNEERKCDALQAEIDALMLEWCPDEISKEQMDTWASHQKKVIIPLDN